MQGAKYKKKKCMTFEPSMLFQQFEYLLLDLALYASWWNNIDYAQVVWARYVFQNIAFTLASLVLFQNPYELYLWSICKIKYLLQQTEKNVGVKIHFQNKKTLIKP